jgi:hypothetical protein
MVAEKLKKFSQHVKSDFFESSEELVWIRCGFNLKSGGKPEGLEEFSSFVIDPYLPLNGGNMGLIRWVVDEKADIVTVWVRIRYHEMNRRSYLTELQTNIEKTLKELFPYFGLNTKSVQPFEDYFGIEHQTRDFLAIVYDPKVGFEPVRHKFKNVYFAGPGFDRGFELLSRLATEYRLLVGLADIRQKEIDRDRKIRSSRNEQDMGSAKQV